MVATPSGGSRPVWHPEETIEAVAYDTPVVGWRGRHVNPLRLWSARAVDPLRLDVFNDGDHVGALSEQARAEAISKILYPSDSTAGRPRIAPAPGVFLCLGLAAGHRPAPPAILQRSAVAAGPGRDPAQRHASEHRDRRADAAPGRRPQPAVGRGVADDRRHLLLHQPHAAAGGAGDAGRSRCSSGCCRGISRSSTASTRSTSKRRASAAFVDGELRGDLDHRREPRPACAHGPSRLCRLAPGQRRLGAAHRADARDRVRRSAPALSRAHRQQDQRHHLSPLAAPGQSGADPAAVATSAAARCSTTRRRSPRLAEYADDADVHPAARGGQARQQDRARPLRPRADRAAVDPDALFDVHIKRIHEYKRQLLNLLDTVARYHAIRADPGGDWVPRVKIFAGKAAASYAQAKLIIKLANDIAAVDQQRPGDARPAAPRLPAELQCQPGRDDHSGGRSVGADLDRRHGGLGHRQHEAGAERRADDRHARRRQCRDPRACRRRQHLHLRADRRGGRGAPPARARRRRCDRRLARTGRGDRRDRRRRLFARRSATASAISPTGCAMSTRT